MESLSDQRLVGNEDGQSIANQTQTLYKCKKCCVVFKHERTLKHHALICKTASRKNYRKCYVAGCESIFLHEKEVIDHMEKSHLISLHKEQLRFRSLDEFHVWKEREQEQKFVYFTQQSGENKVGTIRYIYYICQHDGGPRYNAPSTLRRKTSRLNRKGRVKTTSTCPARLLVKICAANDVIVSYIGSHSHELSFENTKHHPISYSTLGVIKQKLSIGMSSKTVHECLLQNIGVRDKRNSTDIFHRNNFIGLRTLKEIERKLKLNQRLHSDDAQSVWLLVQKLQQEEYNSILIYKPEGGPVVVGSEELNLLTNSNDLFLLAIQTSQQRDCLIMFASKIVCVDATHCTTQYGLQLLNVVVQDEFGKGYPVAHFLSKHMDAQILHYFFSALKDNSPQLDINCVMTDDDYAPWNAIVSVFGNTPKHLLCTWHVLRAWSRKLHSMVHDKDLCRKMFIALRVIMYTTSEPVFEQLVEAFCTSYSELAESFVQYFRLNYLCRIEVWALCRRNFPHGNTDTNMLVESFHNRLKTFYLGRKQNKRLDDLINVLLTIERDDYMRRLKSQLYKERETDSLVCDKRRHERGMLIRDVDVTPNEQLTSSSVENVRSWMICSQSKPNEFHIVNLESEYCTADICIESCTEPCCFGLCCHQYSCSCRDSSRLCKHIHKIQSLVLRLIGAKQPEPSTNDEVNDEQPAQLTLYHKPSETAAIVDMDYESQVCEMRANLQRLCRYGDDAGVRQLLLPHINGVLADLVRKCEAVCNVPSTSVTAMREEVVIAPNENFARQKVPQPMRRFSRKKSRSFLNPVECHEKERTAVELVCNNLAHKNIEFEGMSEINHDFYSINESVIMDHDYCKRN